MGQSTTDNRKNVHWPLISKDYLREFAKFPFTQKNSAAPKCVTCGAHCWWSFSKKKWYHDGKVDPERFMHEGGEVIDDV